MHNSSYHASAQCLPLLDIVSGGRVSFVPKLSQAEGGWACVSLLNLVTLPKYIEAV